MSSQPVPMMRAPYATQGYRAVYRPQQVNHCPGCGHANWLVGRTLAECARCSTAMPLATSVQDKHGARITFQPRQPEIRAVG